MYRVISNTPLSTGHKKGDLISADNFKPAVLRRLLAKNIISPVASPPLIEIPGWTKRAEKLADLGIETAQQFLDADDSILKLALKLRSNTVIPRYKREILDWLKPQAPSG